MSAGEWEKIKTLFDVALAIPGEQRADWLNEVCADAPDLRATLDQLLRNYDESSDSDPRELAVAPVFKAGDIVAKRFQILRLIAHGGMGEVYEARDSSLNGLRVALKTIRTGLASELQAYERFKREVWVTREIAHEGICRIYDLVEHRQVMEDGSERLVPCLTMKLLDGENLATFLLGKRPLRPDQALPIIKQIVQALDFMHGAGIVHRDLKPSNIMLIADSEASVKMRAVITDFGLAKPLNQRSMLWETCTDQQAGAPYFLAPEILGGTKGGIAADIYSLGLVIDEMVTRSPAFPHESIEELFWKKLHTLPEPPAARAPDLPKSWEECICWCLQRDPERRPQRVAEVLEYLEGSNCGVRITQGPDEHLPEIAQSPEPAPVKRVIGRRAWLAATAAAIVLPGVALFVNEISTPISASILVYPFVNVTRRTEYDYLCTGIADELMRRLSFIDDLQVFPVRDRNDQMSISATKAEFSLEGNLLHHQGRVRLTMRLIETATGALIWSDHFERHLEEPLTLESDIAHGIISALSNRLRSRSAGEGHTKFAGRAFGSPVRRLLGRDAALLPVQATTNGTAFEAYLQGRHRWQERTLPGTLAAIAQFKAATELDPKFALAYAALADSQITLLTYNYDSTPKLLTVAREYAQKAVELDPSLPEVHVSLAAVRQNLWDWQGAEAEYKKAIQVRPKFALAHYWYGGLLLQFGRFDEALTEAGRGLENDPLDYPNQSNYGYYLWNAGRLTEAARHLEALLVRKDLLYAHAVAGQVYAALAASAAEPEATNYFVKSLREAGIVRTREMEAAGGTDATGFLKWSDLMFAQAHAARQDRASAEVYVRRLESGFASGRLSASAVAWAHAASGNYSRALELLELGLQRREREMLNVKVIPLFHPLHSDSRFQSILRTMKL
jgi:serine/threonine-protein kinase